MVPGLGFPRRQVFAEQQRPHGPGQNGHDRQQDDEAQQSESGTMVRRGCSHGFGLPSARGFTAGYSRPSATMGSMRAALLAGYNPKKMPMATENAAAPTVTQGDTANGKRSRCVIPQEAR